MKLKRKTDPGADDYLELIKRYPLCVIRNEEALDRAAAVALGLASRGEAKLSHGEQEYLEVLDRLIEDYEEAHHAMPRGETSSLERLQMLVEEAGMSASDLGRLLGNRSLGSLLLSGRREVSKTHMRILADHFRVDAGYFL